MQIIDSYVTPYVINKKEWFGSKISFYKYALRLLQNSFCTLKVIRKHPIENLVCIKREKSNFLAKMSNLGAQESSDRNYIIIAIFCSEKGIKCGNSHLR